MKKGFTLLELLVASLILGIVLLALTSLLTQSQIAWRTGVASVAELSTVRTNIAIVRNEADNVVNCMGEAKTMLCLWDDDDMLRTRAWNVGGQNGDAPSKVTAVKPSEVAVIAVGTGEGAGSSKNYIVNVMSAGPDREFGTWDDIWSCPDEFE